MEICLEKILWESFHKNGIPKPTHTLAEITQKAVKEAMHEACRQVLELAAENADTEKQIIPEIGILKRIGVVDKQSITNTINQVE